MRRLPVYLLLDTSGSMYGEPIEAVKNGVQTLVSSLRQDPYALETAYLSVITFESSAQQITPLTELSAFQQPNLSAGGCTAMGEALALLAQKVDTEVTKTTNDQKGDWRPLVFILTDGEPTDDLNKGLAEFKKRKFGMVVACAAGMGAGCSEKSYALAAEYEREAKELGCHFMDPGHLNMHPNDYMHLDKASHRELAELLYARIKELF